MVAVSAGTEHSLGLKSIGTGIEPPVNTDVLEITSVHPNPTRGFTTVQFNSPGLTGVSLEVLDITGRMVRTDELSSSSPGQHNTTWDGRDSRGEELEAGIYFIRLRSVAQQTSARVMLVR